MKRKPRGSLRALFVVGTAARASAKETYQSIEITLGNPSRPVVTYRITRFASWKHVYTARLTHYSCIMQNYEYFRFDGPDHVFVKGVFVFPKINYLSIYLINYLIQLSQHHSMIKKSQIKI